MSSVTDWLTSIGTVSAVIVSLSYTVFHRLLSRRRIRRNMIWRLRNLSKELFQEIEAIQQEEPLNELTDLETYKVFKIYQTVITFSTDAFYEDIIILGNDILLSLNNYHKNKNEANKTIYIDLMKQVDQLK